MFAKTVWDTLSSIDVNEKIEKKGNLSYLSWSWAWDQLMEQFPASNYQFLENEFTSEGHCTVWCELTVADEKNSITRVMWLPVMDHRNNAIAKPDARKISDTRMRCLTKCIAMFGLGHYIYAGEDLPRQPVVNIEDQVEKIIDGLVDSYVSMVEVKDALGVYIFHQDLKDSTNFSESNTELFNLCIKKLQDSFPKGKKTEYKNRVIEMQKDGLDMIVTELITYIKAEDDAGIEENWDDLTKTVKSQVWHKLDAVCQNYLKDRAK